MQKIKQFLAAVTVMLLLPYVITVFINGPGIRTGGNVGNNYIQVQTASGISEMLLDEYCIGVLAKEVSADFEEEALKAQAVIVRTSLYKKLHESGSSTVFEDRFWTTREMKHQWGAKNFSKNYDKICKAWKGTNGNILTYEGNPATTPFHQLSNGKTRDGKEVLGGDAYPYLKVKDCPKDVEAEKQMETKTVNINGCEITSMDSAGYVTNIKVQESVVSGEEFRKTYQLVSSCFTVQEEEGKTRITTKGIGHGLGLSQYTANEMAKEGKTSVEILQYFFEGTEIKEVAEILVNIE